MIYSCKTYNAYGKHHCTQHRIEFDKLYRLVLEEIRSLAMQALADRDGVAEQLAENCSAEQKAQSETLARQIAKNKERSDLLDKMVTRLYEDMISGKISEPNFEAMLAKAQSEQNEVRKAISHDQELLKKSMQSTENARKWLDMIQEYVTIDELTPEILHRLIKEIVVHETIGDDGHRNISIEIHYNLRPIDGHRNV